MAHYKILASIYPDQLQEDVNSYLAEGYELVGGLVIASATSRYDYKETTYAQAVIYYGTDEQINK